VLDRPREVEVQGVGGPREQGADGAVAVGVDRRRALDARPHGIAQRGARQRGDPGTEEERHLGRAEAVQAGEEQEVGQGVGVAQTVGSTDRAQLGREPVEVARQGIHHGAQPLAGPGRLEVGRKAAQDVRRPAGHELSPGRSVTRPTTTVSPLASWISGFSLRMRTPASRYSAW
jgi:hypothetical protein